MRRRQDQVERPRIAARIPTDDNKLVKSAGRVLEILEYFDDLQQPASVMEIANALGYPQSSTSALLRSLVATGYLNYDAAARAYLTSSRVALLGSWLNSPFFAEGALISLMKELSELTGDAVVLATRNGLYVQYIHVIQAVSLARLHISLGTVRPIAASGSGLAILSAMTDAEITRIVMRINAEAPAGQPLIKLRDLMVQIGQVRERGYCFSCNTVTPGGGIMAVPLPRISGQPQMVIGLAGISEVMREREGELARTLLDQIAHRFGLKPARLSGGQSSAQDPLSAAILRARVAGSA